jgi:hypothetical protein
MGKNFGARMIGGVPPQPGCPTAVGLGCTCPVAPNAELTDNTLGIVAATCPIHGWDRRKLLTCQSCGHKVPVTAEVVSNLSMNCPACDNAFRPNPA